MKMDPGYAQRLYGLVADKLDGLTIIDVGAHSADAPDEIYAALLALPGATLVGFEPNEEECARLNSRAGSGRRFFPHAIGDGKPGQFHYCRSPLTSSLLKPNMQLLERYENLAELCEIMGVKSLETKRLDAMSDIAAPDFLKLDVQGSALQVLEGASGILADTLVLHVETEFVPIYEGEALFSDVERFLRDKGSVFHHFFRLEGRRVRAGKYVVGKRACQTLWADAVFVPSFERLEALQPKRLLALSVIFDIVYRAHDFSMLCLTHYDQRTGDDVSGRYLGLLHDAGVLL